MSSSAVDLGEPGSMARALQAAHPDVVIHTAVSTAHHELERIVVGGSEETARAAAEAGSALIHLSSDMVFDGASGPFEEDAPLSPITDYGRAKAEAERRVRAGHPGAIVVRTSLLFRVTPPDPRTAIWLAAARRGDAYPLFRDEIRCPLEVGDLADSLLALARRLAVVAGAGPQGAVYHLAGPEPLDRYTLGRGILEALGEDPELARAGLSGEDGIQRPRTLVLLARTTPAEFRLALRPVRAALAAARAAREAGGPASRAGA